MEEPQYNQVAEQVGVHATAQQGIGLAEQNRQLQYQMEDQEKNLAEAQLDCDETLFKISNMLKQNVYKLNEEKQIMEWTPISDSKKRVLTDEGVDRIMQAIQSYINKETLLSNFSEEKINERMLKFSLSLNGILFLKYELYFRTPNLEECQEILRNKIETKVKKRKMSCELLQQEFDEKKTRRQFLDELEPRMEYELTKIREEKMKENLREFEMIFTQIEALVEATHNRAWKGEERGSLRRHFNISEVIGGSPQQQQQKKRFGIF